MTTKDMTKDDRIQMFLMEMPDAISKYKMDEYLDSLGFFEAPASTRFHGAYAGGLFDHSFVVTHQLYRLTETLQLVWGNPASPFIVGMCHDLCKCDQYKLVTPEDGSAPYYSYNRYTPIHGHGTKSAILTKQLISDLTLEEEACIIHHMGAYGTSSDADKYTEAIHKYQNVLWTHTADMMAAHIAMV